MLWYVSCGLVSHKYSSAITTCMLCDVYSKRNQTVVILTLSCAQVFMNVQYNYSVLVE